MLTLQLALTVAALVAALAAFLKWRRAAKTLERLAESYWEVRYECGQLRSRIERLEAGDTGTAPPAAPASSATSFVPLSSLKR